MNYKDVKGLEGMYKIGENGDIISYRRKIPKQLVSGDNGVGYLCLPITVQRKQSMKLIHRLVAEAFVPNPHNKKYVNHKDGDKYNNHYLNLEWVDAHENMSHASRMGLLERGEKRYNAKLTNEQVLEIRRLFHAGTLNGAQKAKEFGVSTALISRIANNKQWTHDFQNITKKDAEKIIKNLEEEHGPVIKW